MVDTILIWSKAENSPGVDLLGEVPLRLTNLREKYDYRHGCNTITGKLGVFFVTVSEQGVLLSGSLCKFYFGDNQRTLGLQEIHGAIEKLIEAIGLPIDKARVYRLDIAANYVMNHPVKAYYTSLGSHIYHERTEIDHSVYYGNKQHQLVFYDKVEEQLTKRVKLRDELIGKNVLRYEYRLRRNLAKQLKRKKVLVSDLYDKAFYTQLLEKYKEEYLAIYKYNSISFKGDVLRDVRSFKAQLLLLGIKALGGEAPVMKLIEQANRRQVFSNVMQKSRLKNMIRKLCNTPLLTYKPDEIKELDKKILDTVNMEIKSLELNEKQ